MVTDPSRSVSAVGRILVVTWAGDGHVTPALALAEQLQANGHAVRAMGTAALEERFAAEGVPFRARDPLAEWDQAALARDVQAEAQSTDIVISDYMLPGALCGAEASHRPSVVLVPALFATQFNAGELVPMRQSAGVASLAPVTSLAPVRAELGLPPIATFGALLDRATRVLVTVPEELDRPLARRAPNVRYVGPVLHGPGPDAGWRPPGLDDGHPLVVVSVDATSPEAGAARQRVLSALADAPVRVVATASGHLEAIELEVPANAHATGTVRLAAVLPWASAVVSDGGLNTILAALTHALPVVCLAQGGEGSAAAAVERVGAGIVLDRQAPPDAIRSAVRKALGDLELRAGAARMALRIDELRQAAAPVAEVETLL